MNFWSNDELSFAIKLFDANAKHVGHGLRFRTKSQLFAFIAEKLKSFGSTKTVANVTDKFKNLNAKHSVIRKHVSDDQEANDMNETILQKYESKEV
jgi:flagellar biosynthesis/type III secretory pathway chaperone